jgi:hypothetical protein
MTPSHARLKREIAECVRLTNNVALQYAAARDVARAISENHFRKGATAAAWAARRIARDCDQNYKVLASILPKESRPPRYFQPSPIESAVETVFLAPLQLLQLAWLGVVAVCCAPKEFTAAIKKGLQSWKAERVAAKKLGKEAAK